VSVRSKTDSNFFSGFGISAVKNLVLLSLQSVTSTLGGGKPAMRSLVSSLVNKYQIRKPWKINETDGAAGIPNVLMYPSLAASHTYAVLKRPGHSVVVHNKVSYYFFIRLSGGKGRV
jgi:hypothetical protein